MELNDTNFQTLAQYLQQTLSPDPSVRRPGKIFFWLSFLEIFSYIFFLLIIS